MTYRLRREARLTKKREFEEVFEGGARFRGAHLDAVVGRKPNGLETPRLGISVSAKVGNAVVRNRLRRLVRESFRCARPEMTKAVDVVIVVKSGKKATGLEAIQSEFRDLLTRAGIL